MKKILLSMILFLNFSFAQITQTITYNVSGKSRNFVVHVPKDAKNAPLVFFVHGYGGNGSGFANDTKANDIADREKFIAVYPSAVGGSWDMYNDSDYPFLLSVIDTVDARYSIDRNRVYCSGFSQGGFISHGLGYKYPDIFAAVAPVSGHLPSFAKSTGSLSRPVPVFITFGTNDVSSVESFMDDINVWFKLNNCSKDSRRFDRHYPTTNSNSDVARITYECENNTQIMIDSIVTGGHEWAMDTQRKVNTTEEVWAFFKQFSLEGSQEVEQSAYKQNVIPGKIQMEDYDLGGSSVAYYDDDATNNGKYYRNDGVDIDSILTGGYTLGWLVEKEWVEYTIDFTVSGEIYFEANVASDNDGGAFHIEIDGTAVTEKITVPNTSGFDKYELVSGKMSNISKGSHVLRVAIDGAYFNLDWIDFGEEPLSIPKKGKRVKLKKQVSYFDLLGRNK